MARILFLSACQTSADHLVAPPTLFFQVVGELGFHYIAERTLLVEQGQRGRAEAVRAVVAAGASMTAHVRSALFSELWDIGTPSSLDVQ
jgi:hypothetical protein